MPTKVQAKAAIDAACVAIKTDIDIILPDGVNIADGLVSFGPTRWRFVLNAGNSRTTAETLISAIINSLNASGRTHEVKRLRRDDDGAREYTIITALAVYTISNIGTSNS